MPHSKIIFSADFLDSARILLAKRIKGNGTGSFNAFFHIFILNPSLNAKEIYKAILNIQKHFNKTIHRRVFQNTEENIKTSLQNLFRRKIYVTPTPILGHLLIYKFII